MRHMKRILLAVVALSGVTVAAHANGPTAAGSFPGAVPHSARAGSNPPSTGAGSHPASGHPRSGPVHPPDLSPGHPKTVPATHPTPKPGHPPHPPTVRCPPAAGGRPCPTAHYAAQHGMWTKSGCYVYRGMGHQHWTCRHYSPTHRCWCWYDPCTAGWYYWCGARGYYLPVRYITVLVPTVTVEAAPPAELPPCGGELPTATAAQIPELPELNGP